MKKFEVKFIEADISYANANGTGVVICHFDVDGTQIEIEKHNFTPNGDKCDYWDIDCSVIVSSKPQSDLTDLEIQKVEFITKAIEDGEENETYFIIRDIFDSQDCQNLIYEFIEKLKDDN